MFLSYLRVKSPMINFLENISFEGITYRFVLILSQFFFFQLKYYTVE